MATNTTNEGFVKPDGGDLYDIAIYNTTLDKLDAKIAELRALVGKVSTLPDGIVTGPKLADNTIPASKFMAGSVKTLALEDGAVTSQKLADDAVTGDKIAPDAIGNEHLSANAVAAENIVDGSILPIKIPDGSIGALKIANGSITKEKLGFDALSLLIGVKGMTTQLISEGGFTTGVETKIQNFSFSGNKRVLAISHSDSDAAAKWSSARLVPLGISAQGYNLYTIYVVPSESKPDAGYFEFNMLYTY